MNNPLIFLDCDGVLNNHTQQPNGFCGVTRRCANQFNRVLKATDAKLVISSAWRYMVHAGSMTLRGFEHLLCTHGIDAHDRVIGITPRDEDREGWTRGEQIRHWLNEHGDGRRYVVIDDLANVGIKEAGHPFVQTMGSLGLNRCDADLAIRLLRATGRA